MTNENHTEAVDRVGSTNSDGSTDWGCFQINDYWHKPFFEQNNWADPVANAKYAYGIYLGRVKSEGNGWRAWYAVEGILW